MFLYYVNKLRYKYVKKFEKPSFYEFSHALTWAYCGGPTIFEIFVNEMNEMKNSDSRE
jgi:hypothetical protein